MRQNRRDLLRTAAVVATSAGIAGCNGSTSTDGNATGGAADGTATGTTAGPAEGDGTASLSLSADVAVAAEWNAMRSRLDDAYLLGVGGNAAAGAGVAQRVFQRFENANSEYGAHEFLEETSEDNYEGFEDGLGNLQSALDEGDLSGAADGWTTAKTNLRAAQLAVLGEQATYAMDLLQFGAAVDDLAVLAAAGHTDGADSAGEEIQSTFEDSAAHDVFEDANSEAYESFESALETARTEASNGNVEATRTASDDALSATVTGAYAVADPDEAVGAGHLAAMQAVGFDAAVSSSLGGPSTDFAHAATLTLYRARAHDTAWLAAVGETDTANQYASDTFAHFEGARAHEALEEADHDAYEGFESGLDALSAATAGDGGSVTDALGTVDDNLVTGIDALVSETGAAVLEAAFFRARVADARERYRLGDQQAAADIAQALFADFEADELGFHEAFEEADHEAYESFEQHLDALQTAFADGDNAAVETEASAVLEGLLDFETTVGATAQVSAAESAYMAARGFDAAAVAAAGESTRSASVVQSTFEFFEDGAGGFHEALEEADHDAYETFEDNLGAIREAANSGGDVYAAATTYNQDAVDAAYTVVENADGASSGVAASIAGDAFGAFESAAVHETLEEADHETYETFEAELEALSSTIEDGGDVRASVRAYADATTRAQFAVVGALDQAPAASGGESSEETAESEETELSGGPNVVEGVPEDADHVVDMQAVAFEPAALTVSVGDTVAFAHRDGEAHNVVAREDEIPDDADYWASGDFDSESAASEGWENGQGAVQSGQSFTHTFETAGEHPYYCVPHEMAGMEGTITVEQ